MKKILLTAIISFALISAQAAFAENKYLRYYLYYLSPASHHCKLFTIERSEGHWLVTALCKNDLDEYLLNAVKATNYQLKHLRNHNGRLRIY